MWYLALLGYFVSVYTVYNWAGINWSAKEITLSDLVYSIMAIILVITPCINSAVTIGIWVADFMLWASTVVILRKK